MALYQFKHVYNWADLPKELPPDSTAYWYYKQWREVGSIEKLMDLLHGQVREQVKKKAQGITLIIIDSQAVQNTCNEGGTQKAFTSTKRPMGLNDTLRWLR